MSPIAIYMAIYWWPYWAAAVWGAPPAVATPRAKTRRPA